MVTRIFSKRKEVVVIDNPNSMHAINSFKEENHEERYKYHCRLIDLMKDGLYGVAIPGIEE